MTFTYLKKYLFEDINIGVKIKSINYYIQKLNQFLHETSKTKKEENAKQFIKEFLDRTDQITGKLTKLSCGLMIDSVEQLKLRYAGNQALLNKAGEMLGLELVEHGFFKGIFKSDKYISQEDYPDVLESIEICKTFKLREIKQ